MQNISHAGTGLAHNPKINALTARHTDKILFLQPAPRQRIQDDVKTTAVDLKTAVGGSSRTSLSSLWKSVLLWMMPLLSV